MKTYKIQLDEKVSVWQRLEMIVEAEDEQTLKKQIERQSLNIIEMVDVETFHDTEEFLEYDTEYLEITEIIEETTS
jgi:ABC-type ATPase with predicted acetyltransferase domain